MATKSQDLNAVVGCIRDGIEFFRTELDHDLLPGTISKLVGVVPDEVLLLYTNKEEIDKLNQFGIWWHYGPISLDDVIAGEHPNQALITHTGHGKIHEEYVQTPFLTNDRIGYLDEESSVELDYANELFPILEFEGYWAYFNNSNETNLNGIVGEVDSIADYLAPSILQHLEDLLDGLNQGRYMLNPHNVVLFPLCWSDRERLKNGLITMDEFGQVHEGT